MIGLVPGRTTEHVLLADGLWRVQHMPQPILPSPQSFLRIPLKANKSRTWGFPRIPALQLELWRLPHRRVLYLDCDHLPLPTSKKRLHNLWHTRRNVSLAAAPERPEEGQNCFNSGMMMLHPRGAASFESLRILWQDLARVASWPRLLRLRERCPTGWNLDQPILNLAFEQTWAWDVAWRPWRMLTPSWPDPGQRPAFCDDAKSLSANALADIGESFHFYGTFRPWSQRGAKELAACSGHRQLDCNVSELARRQATTVQQGCTALLATASAFWWSHLHELPHGARRTCIARVARSKP